MMDQMQAPQAIPHIVQVYQPSVSNTKMQNPQIIHISHPSLQHSQGKVTYHQRITSESLHIPSAQPMTEIQNQHVHMSQNLIMSCQQAHLQALHQPQLSSQVLQSADMSQQLQITSHMVLPQVPVFKQHMLLNTQQQYYAQYEYPKEQCIVAKSDPEPQLMSENQIKCKSENAMQIEIEILPTKRTRSQIPNPSTWACNIRKLKHQRGEAYVSRRGKYVPERCVRNTKDCLKTCKLKCNERINDTDRELIFKAFYSLNANEKKHFLLNTTERNYIKHNKTGQNHKRKFSFKYFFLIRSVRHTVCKNFYLGTLSISQKPVYNVHLGKSEMNIPKPDGRGLSDASTHSLPCELKDRVRKHILSFNTVDSKPVKQYSKKVQYLNSNLSIKQMYTMYQNGCSKDNVEPVKESMYRKIFKQEFNLHFRKIKNPVANIGQMCCKCKGDIKKK